MLEYITGRDKEIAHAVTKAIPHMYGRNFGQCKTIGILRDGKLIAGVVYHNWMPEHGVIEMSAAALPGSGWLTRETIRQIYGYPFNEAKAQMLINWARADDERLLRQLAVGGFMFIRVPRLLGRNCDAVLCLLTREQWASNKIFQHDRRDLEKAA